MINMENIKWGYLQTIYDKLDEANVLKDVKHVVALFPHEISSIPMQLNGRNFVYILCRKHKPIYVGKTKTLRTRINVHRADKVFSDLIVLEYDESNVFKKEEMAIKALNPIKNVKHNNTI